RNRRQEGRPVEGSGPARVREHVRQPHTRHHRQEGRHVCRRRWRTGRARPRAGRGDGDRPAAEGELSVMLPCPLAADERALFERASAWPGLAWPDLTADVLRELADAEGIDFATALLYHRLRSSVVHGPFIERLETLPDSAGPPPGAADALVAVVPGGFYRERPDTGADGRFLLDQAVALGCRTAVVPVASFGGLRENARIVCNWLREQHGSIVLVSLSKSGAEVRLALEEPDADACFTHVRAWINLSGIVRGTPMVSWLFRHPLRCLAVRLLFGLHGYSYRALHDMERGP